MARAARPRGRASRILVEGVHDAELVEKVWGDDLREVGVVVERLDGMDDLADVVRDLAPGPAAGSASCWTTWSTVRRRRGQPPRSGTRTSS